MVRRARLGGLAAVLMLACGARTIDYGDYGDYAEGPSAGRGGSGGFGFSKGGGSSKAGSGAISKGGGGPMPAGGTGFGGTFTGGSGPFPVAGAPNNCKPYPPFSGLAMIDDMEDVDLVILPYDGRSGRWYGYSDNTSTQLGPSAVSLFPARAGQSLYGMFTFGHGFTDWGAGIGFLLNDTCPYNASYWAGIRFYAWAGNAMDVVVRFNLNTSAVTPIEYGGTCVSNCWDSHGVEVTVIDDWGLYEIPFHQLQQTGFGSFVPFDATQILSVQFQMGPYQTFELWIDDVSFF